MRPTPRRRRGGEPGAPSGLGVGSGRRASVTREVFMYGDVMARGRVKECFMYVRANGQWAMVKGTCVGDGVGT